MINQPRRKFDDGTEESDAEHERRVRIALRQAFTELARAPFTTPPKSHPSDSDYDPTVGPIVKLGDFSPAKRMWRSFHSIAKVLENPAADFSDCLYDVIDARDAYLDWKDRNHLPGGLQPDPGSDMTLLYVNNTLYGEMTDGALRFDSWTERSSAEKPAYFKSTLLNGDYFIHGYANPDFGGQRGWENVFKSTKAVGGQGSMFTFGRFHWRFNAVGGAVGVPPAVKQCLKRDAQGKPVKSGDGYELEDIVRLDVPKTATQLSPNGKPLYDDELPAAVRPGIHKVWFRFNFEPSIRLRFYQFDPLHHDVNIYSVH